VLEKAETDMMRNVLRLGNRAAGDVMTPRPDIVWLDIADPVPDLLREVMDSPFSRFPVAQGNIDNLLGVLDAKTLLRPCAGGSPPDIQALLRKPLVVPETMPALNLLAEFRQSEIPFALVADEFGSILGVVTTDDVLQSILGDLGGATADDGERACVVRADGSWLIAGFMPVDEMRDTLQLDPLPGEEEGHYRTMAGFVMYQLGHLPTAGEAFEHAGLRFEVVDMDANRVDKVLVAPAASLPGKAGPGNGHP
jgi:putative hemolysin